MCNHIRLKSQVIKILKGKGDCSESCLNELEMVVLEKFNRANIKLGLDRVVTISSDISKTSKLQSLIFHRILALKNIQSLRSLIYLNKFHGDFLIIDQQELTELLYHAKTGLSQARFKKIFIISDNDVCQEIVESASILLKNSEEKENIIISKSESMEPRVEPLSVVKATSNVRVEDGLQTSHSATNQEDTEIFLTLKKLIENDRKAIADAKEIESDLNACTTSVQKTISI